MADSSQDGRVPVVEVIVEEALEFPALGRLQGTVAEALELHPGELVIDLARCPRLDAAAIGFLLQLHRSIRLDGGLLTLRSPSAGLRRNLRLAHADVVLHVTGPDGAPQTPVPVAALAATIGPESR